MKLIRKDGGNLIMPLKATQMPQDNLILSTNSLGKERRTIRDKTFFVGVGKVTLSCLDINSPMNYIGAMKIQVVALMGDENSPPLTINQEALGEIEVDMSATDIILSISQPHHTRQTKPKEDESLSFELEHNSKFEPSSVSDKTPDSYSSDVAIGKDARVSDNHLCPHSPNTYIHIPSDHATWRFNRCESIDGDGFCMAVIIDLLAPFSPHHLNATKELLQLFSRRETERYINPLSLSILP